MGVRDILYLIFPYIIMGKFRKRSQRKIKGGYAAPPKSGRKKLRRRKTKRRGGRNRKSLAKSRRTRRKKGGSQTGGDLDLITVQGVASVVLYVLAGVVVTSVPVVGPVLAILCLVAGTVQAAGAIKGIIEYREERKSKIWRSGGASNPDLLRKYSNVPVIRMLINMAKEKAKVFVDELSDSEVDLLIKKLEKALPIIYTKLPSLSSLLEENPELLQKILQEHIPLIKEKLKNISLSDIMRSDLQGIIDRLSNVIPLSNEKQLVKTKFKYSTSPELEKAIQEARALQNEASLGMGVEKDHVVTEKLNEVEEQRENPAQNTGELA